jgi:hypothetical protein
MTPTGPTGPTGTEPYPPEPTGPTGATGPGEPIDPGGLPHEPPTPNLSVWQQIVLWFRNLFR